MPWHKFLEGAEFSSLTGDVNTPLALHRALGVRRFATLNYDFELERLSMLASATPAKQERDGKPTTFNSPFSELVTLWRSGRSDAFQWNLGSGNIQAEKMACPAVMHCTDR